MRHDFLQQPLTTTQISSVTLAISQTFSLTFNHATKLGKNPNFALTLCRKPRNYVLNINVLRNREKYQGENREKKNKNC